MVAGARQLNTPVVLVICLAELAILASQYNAFAAVVVIEDRPVGFQLTVPDNYDKYTPPKLNDLPAIVSVCFMPSKIVDILLESMTLRISGMMFIIWSDGRVNMTFNSTMAPFTKFFLRPDESEIIWKPLLSFRNAMGNTLLTGKVRYYDGNFNYELRRTSTFHCNFNLAFYPMDIQECSMQVQAFNYKSSVTLIKFVRQYEFTSKINPKGYLIADVHSGNCMSGDHFSRYYSCVQYSFKLQRRLGRHLIQTFIPSGLVVILSWVSFWLDPASSMAPRITIGITTMLTLTRQFSSAQHDLPAVSYLKAIDIWMLTCMFMIFSALLEFAFVHVKNKNSTHLARTPLTNAISEKNRRKLEWKVEFEYTPSTTDKISRRAFPLIFTCFNLIFWCYYTL